MSRASPASRARRRIVCILPSSELPSARISPSSSPDFAKNTLLPYYRSSRDGADEYSIRYQCSPPPEPLSELRCPPVDPRKARRYCTDFGLGRALPIHEVSLPPPPPLMYHHDNSSSAGSTPQATYAETASDASSFYQDIDLEFPQPPASPALRRMQSSPLFTPEETNAVREFLRKRWGSHMRSQPAQNSRSACHRTQISQQELLDSPWDTGSPDCRVGAGPGPDTTIAPIDIALELQGEALMQAETSRRQGWFHQPHDKGNEYNVAPLRPRRPAAPPAPARVLRRAASMASPTTPSTEDAPPLPTRFLRFEEIPSGDAPSLASAGRQKPHHRSNLSVPLMGLGLPDAAGHPVLGSSFTHRTALSQPTNFPRTRVANPKSFIDLTPEKVAQRESTARVHRDRVKKLLSRASSGIIGWSKGLTGKKGHC